VLDAITLPLKRRKQKAQTMVPYLEMATTAMLSGGSWKNRTTFSVQLYEVPRQNFADVEHAGRLANCSARVQTWINTKVEAVL
jgi:hypothetical protein